MLPKTRVLKLGGALPLWGVKGLSAGWEKLQTEYIAQCDELFPASPLDNYTLAIKVSFQPFSRQERLFKKIENCK